ncbi:MAG: DUF1579 domain-containing protein [Gemmataceae bacterium]|nr:DUF1579 domain-containing protein [Gemmataceae bacterium]
MKKIIVVGFVVSLLAGSAVLRAQSTPQKEHAWLKQLAGEWEYDAELTFEPGKPPIKCNGVESVRTIGEFWIISESKGVLGGTPITGITTIGYDAQKKKYIGTWIDSVNSHLLHLEGTTDAAGKSLTLQTEGPNPAAGGKLTKFKDEIEIKSKDHKIHTSFMQAEDGKWNPFMKADYRRKK